MLAPRYHVVTIDAQTGEVREGRFRGPGAIPSFIGVPDLFSRPSFGAVPDWPQAPDGYRRLVRGTSGSPDAPFHRHYFIFEREDDQ